MAVSLSELRTLPRFKTATDEEMVAHAQAAGVKVLDYTPPPEKQEPGFISSRIVAPLAQGGASLVGSGGWLAEHAGLDSLGRGLQDTAKGWDESISKNMMSQSARDDAAKTIFDENGNYGGYNFGTAAHDVLSSLPGMLPGVGVAKAAAVGSRALKLGEAVDKIANSGVIGKSLAAGVVKKIGGQAIADTAAGTVGISAYDGLYSGASNATELERKIRQTSINTLSNHPEFQNAYDETDPEKDVRQRLFDAREIIAKKASEQQFADTAIATALTDMVTGGGVEGMLAGTAKSKAKTALGRMGEGALKEGAQETGQSALEKYAENKAVKDYVNPSQDMNEGVAESAIRGGIAGSIMGNLGGLSGRADSFDKKPENLDVEPGNKLLGHTKQLGQGDTIPDKPIVFNDGSQVSANQFYSDRLEDHGDTGRAKRETYMALNGKPKPVVGIPELIFTADGTSLNKGELIRGFESQGATESQALAYIQKIVATPVEHRTAESLDPYNLIQDFHENQRKQVEELAKTQKAQPNEGLGGSNTTVNSFLDSPGLKPTSDLAAGDKTALSSVLPRFLSPGEIKANEFKDNARNKGITDEAILDAIAPQHQTDSLTGFNTAEHKVPTVKRAMEYTKGTGVPSAYIEADLHNLGGLNTHFSDNHELSNPVYRQLSDIFADEMQKAGATSVNIRHGGDEFGSVVVGGTEESIAKAIHNTRERVHSFVKNSGFDKLPHPKHKGDESKYGLSLHIGSSEITPDSTLDDIFNKASIGIHRSKNNVNREQAETDGAVAPEGQAERASGGDRQNGAGYTAETSREQNTPTADTRRRNTVKPTDELKVAVRKLGGIQYKSRQGKSDGADKAGFSDFKKDRFMFHNGKRSQTLDGMAEALREEGYDIQGENDLIEKLYGSLNGHVHYTPEGFAAHAEREYAYREEGLSQQAEQATHALEQDLEAISEREAIQWLNGLTPDNFDDYLDNIPEFDEDYYDRSTESATQGIVEAGQGEDNRIAEEEVQGEALLSPQSAPIRKGNNLTSPQTLDLFATPDEQASLKHKQALKDLERKKDNKRNPDKIDGGELFGDNAALAGQQDIQDVKPEAKGLPDKAAKTPAVPPDFFKNSEITLSFYNKDMKVNANEYLSDTRNRMKSLEKFIDCLGGG